MSGDESGYVLQKGGRNEDIISWNIRIWKGSQGLTYKRGKQTRRRELGGMVLKE